MCIIAGSYLSLSHKPSEQMYKQHGFRCKNQSHENVYQSTSSHRATLVWQCWQTHWGPYVSADDIPEQAEIHPLHGYTARQRRSALPGWIFVSATSCRSFHEDPSLTSSTVAAACLR